MDLKRTNKIKLSPNKMEVLLFGSHLILGSGYTPSLHGAALPLKAFAYTFKVLLVPSLLLHQQHCPGVLFISFRWYTTYTFGSEVSRAVCSLKGMAD